MPAAVDIHAGGPPDLRGAPEGPWRGRAAPALLAPRREPVLGGDPFVDLDASGYRFRLFSPNTNDEKKLKQFCTGVFFF